MPVRSSDFATLTLEDARDLEPDLPEADANRPFVEGDHLQKGDAWIGPGPLSGDPQFGEFFARLEVLFIFKNVIAEVLDRLVSAVVGREPRWAWVPRRTVTKEEPITDTEESAIDELEAALTEWWDARQVHRLLKELLFKLLWAEQSVWRLYVPAGLTDDVGRLNVTTLADALRKIFLDVPEPEDAFVFQHPTTKQRLGVVFFKDANDRDACELTFLERDQTVIKILPESAASVNTATHDMGGHLPIFQLEIDRGLVTGSVRSLQKALNKSLTMLSKNETDNQFLERLFFDTLPPGRWETDPQNPQRRVYVVDEAKARATGNRIDSYMQSVVHEDDEGRQVPAKGGVTIREPLDPEGAIRGAEYWYQALLEEVRQDHILINQSATPSGKSRDEARGDFAASGEDAELQLELGGRELLETVVRMAEAFIGRPGQWTKDFRPIFKTRPRYGRPTIEERAQNLDEAEKGFVSDETAMSLNGIDDVDAERNLIMAQPRAELNLSSDRADVVTKWSTDFPREVALHLAGYTDDEINDIMERVAKADEEDPPPEPVVNPPAPASNGKRTGVPPVPVGA